MNTLNPTVVESVKSAKERGVREPAEVLADITNRAVVIGSYEFVDWARIQPKPWYAPLQFQYEHVPVRMKAGEMLVAGMEGYDSAEAELVEFVIFPSKVAHAFVRRVWASP